jgi:peptide/nickel transport system permease protein
MAAAIAMALGVTLGLLSGYMGGLVDQVMMRVVDVMLAFPYLLLAMIVVAILGPSIFNAMIAVGLVNVPQYARLVRGCVLSVRTAEYVSAAQALGIPHRRIVGRHIFPNVLAPIIVQATLGIGQAIVWAAGLSFLGLGAQPPAPEWGAMLATGREYMLQAPWLATFPGLAILVTVLGFNLLGDGLRDALDPRLR